MKQEDSVYKKIIAVIAWATVLLLWMSAASVFVNPAYFRFASILGLAFPFFLALVAGMLVFCLLFARNKCWIPLLGMAACFLSIRSYIPVNLPSPAPKNSIKLLSYNTLGFTTFLRDSLKEEAIFNYIGRSGADIFCFQEGNTLTPDIYEKRVLGTTRATMPYNDTVNFSSNILGCTSRFPILRKEVICRYQMNGAVVFYLLLNDNDTLRLINCHLQSMGLTAEDREQYHDIVVNPEEKRGGVEKHSRLLVSKISRASVIRAAQADSVAAYIGRNAGKSIIVCGDFNDTPISYTHHRIHSAGLTDAYAATATGLGRSFNRDAIIVRIDHMFCSSHWKPYACHIDNSINASDHYPLIGHFQRVRTEAENDKKPI